MIENRTMGPKEIIAGLVTREIEDSDLPAANALSIGLGWPHRLEDWRFLHQLGFGLGAFVEGDLIGTALWWPMGETHATVGMVIVSPQYQGNGIGRLLMRQVLERTGDRSVALNATEAGLALYTASGFRMVGKIRQHQGILSSAERIPTVPGYKLRPVTPNDLPVLSRLDQKATGTRREPLLSTMIANGVVIEECKTETGFAMIRRFGRGHVIGPVVARNLEGAKMLIGHWLASSAGSFIRLDVPAIGGISSWLSGIGLECVGEVTSMIRGEAPPADRDCLFSLAAQALG